MLVCVDHFTSWPIVRATTDATAFTVMHFVDEEIIHPFPPKTIVSDNAACFTTKTPMDFMTRHGVSWKYVLAYAQMSNVRSERMVGTIKKSLGWTVVLEPSTWPTAIPPTLLGHRRGPSSSGVSPFLLMYGVRPRLLCTDPSVMPQTTTGDDRRAAFLATVALQARRGHMDDEGTSRSATNAIRTFEVGDKVLVMHVRGMDRGNHWPSFKCVFYGPAIVILESHARYTLHSSTGQYILSAVRARRLAKYVTRPSHVI